MLHEDTVSDILGPNIAANKTLEGDQGVRYHGKVLMNRLTFQSASIWPAAAKLRLVISTRPLSGQLLLVVHPRRPLAIGSFPR